MTSVASNTLTILDNSLSETHSNKTQLKEKSKVKPAKSTKKTCQKIKVDEECSICFNCPSRKNRKRLLCKHAFCKECIGQWLKNNNTCPNCRKIHKERKKRFKPPSRLINESLIDYIHRVVKPTHKYKILVIESGIINPNLDGLPIITPFNGFKGYLNIFPEHGIIKLCDEFLNGIFVMPIFTNIYFLDEYE